MNLPQFTATDKAQAFGMAVGFALALLATHRLGLGLNLFVIGWAAAWAGWEFTGAKRAMHVASVPMALASGFVIPWGGFLLAYAMEALRP